MIRVAIAIATDRKFHTKNISRVEAISVADKEEFWKKISDYR